MSQTEVNRFVNLLQGFILLCTVAGVFMSLGAANNVLQQNTDSVDELKAIASDLVRAQVMSTVTDDSHSKAIADLVLRVNRLEDKD